MEDALKIEDGYTLLMVIVVAVIAQVIGWKLGFYRSLRAVSRPFPKIGLGQLILLLASYLTFQVIISVAVVGFFALISGTINAPEWKNWSTIIIIFFLPLLIGPFYYKLNPRAFTALLGGEWQSNLKNFGLGFAVWFLAFPAAQVVGTLCELFVSNVFGPPAVEQEAVMMLKTAYKYPWQYSLIFIGISSAIPFVEELVARGGIQSWLSQKVGPEFGLIVASLFFTLAHYSSGYGWNNLTLLPTLYVLSLYLGYVFERQHSLWASLGLHSAFNFISACMITYQIMTEA